MNDSVARYFMGDLLFNGSIVPKNVTPVTLAKIYPCVIVWGGYSSGNKQHNKVIEMKKVFKEIDGVGADPQLVMQDIMINGIDEFTSKLFGESWSLYPSLELRSNVDPLDVVISTGLNGDAYDVACYQFSIRAIYQDMIDWCRDEGEYKKELNDIAAELRRLADELEFAAK